MFQYFLFKLVLELFGKSFFLSVTIDLSLVNLDDVFHSFQTIVKSQGLGGSSMLVSKEEGFHSLLKLGFLSLLKSTSDISPFELVKVNFPDGLPFMKLPWQVSPFGHSIFIFPFFLPFL